jgi:hypothetical protein
LERGKDAKTMTLTIELTPELEQRLCEAEAMGLKREALLRSAQSVAIDYIASVLDIKEAVSEMEGGPGLSSAESRRRSEEMLEWARTLPREEFLAKMRERDKHPYGG